MADIDAGTELRRRLMDMLIGWSDYASDCSESAQASPPGPEVYRGEQDAARILYQRVGALGVSEGREATTEELMAFIENDVLPLLVRGAPSAARP